MDEQKSLYYQLTQDADDDLDAIFDYTELHHSFEQAEKYLTELENHFLTISNEPFIGRHRIDLKNGIYSSTINQHIILYSIQKEFIMIIRILHGRRDLPKFIEK